MNIIKVTTQQERDYLRDKLQEHFAKIYDGNHYVARTFLDGKWVTPYQKPQNNYNWRTSGYDVKFEVVRPNMSVWVGGDLEKGVPKGYEVLTHTKTHHTIGV